MSVEAHRFTSNVDPEQESRAWLEQVQCAEDYKGGYQGEPGIELQPGGCNFAVYTENAIAVDLNIRDDDEPGGITKTHRLLPVFSETGVNWAHGGFIPGLEPGQKYTMTAHYTNNPNHSNHGLIDPYARVTVASGNLIEVNGRIQPEIVAVVPYPEDKDTIRPSKPDIEPRDLVFYEAQIDNLTRLNPDIPEEIRGTYSAIAHPSTIEYLKRLGVTVLELLPVQQALSQEYANHKGISSHWGYDTIGHFSPDSRFASDKKNPASVIAEFKAMVDTLHEAGIKVVLDVVYNHTAEGGNDGWDSNQQRDVKYPIHSLKALGNDTYYRTNANGNYLDSTGCGNSLNTSHPVTQKYILDSLRYWVEEMGVDGVRFDLFATLTRDEQGNQQGNDSSFLKALLSDPVLSKSILVAEPWDLGPDGHLSGRLDGLKEWADGFREGARKKWLGRYYNWPDIANLTCGSYKDKGKAINFITAHDGFTLNDLVSYDRKRNEGNREDNRDGSNDPPNGFGVDGPTDDESINTLRRQMARNLMTDLVISKGVPMVLSGDEILNTQYGNNNAWCQNNEISWINRGPLSAEEQRMLDYTTNLIALRKESTIGDPNFHFGELRHKNLGITNETQVDNSNELNVPMRRRHTIADIQADAKGIEWLDSAGRQMNDDDWSSSPILGAFFSELGDSNLDGSDTNKPIGSGVLYYSNPSATDVEITLPNVNDSGEGNAASAAGKYILVAESKQGHANNQQGLGIVPERFILPAKSSIVLKRIATEVPDHIIEERPNTSKVQLSYIQNLFSTTALNSIALNVDHKTSASPYDYSFTRLLEARSPELPLAQLPTAA